MPHSPPNGCTAAGCTDRSADLILMNTLLWTLETDELECWGDSKALEVYLWAIVRHRAVVLTWGCQ